MISARLDETILRDLMSGKCSDVSDQASWCGEDTFNATAPFWEAVFIGQPDRSTVRRLVKSSTRGGYRGFDNGRQSTDGKDDAHPNPSGWVSLRRKSPLRSVELNIQPVCAL
jgi:hypothetical protein